MNLKTNTKYWNNLGKHDPFWAVLTDHDKKDGKWKRSDFFREGELEVKKLLNELERSKIFFSRDKALDFGCGVGRLTQALSKHFKHTTGVDAATSMVKLAEKLKQNKDVEYILNNENNLNIFRSNTFDFIYSNKTLQHIPQKYSLNYISELFRVLKKNGVLVFNLPSTPTWNIKGFLIRIIPERFLNILRGEGFSGVLRYLMGKKVDRFGMYGIKRQVVEDFLLQKGAIILNTKRDNDSGKGWVFYRYFVKK